jgi:hypothetical protein
MKRALSDKHIETCLNYTFEFHGYSNTEINIETYLIEVQNINNYLVE